MITDILKRESFSNNETDPQDLDHADKFFFHGAEHRFTLTNPWRFGGTEAETECVGSK